MQIGGSLRAEAFSRVSMGTSGSASTLLSLELGSLPPGSSLSQALTSGTFVAEPGVKGSSSLGCDEPLDSMSLPGRQWVGRTQRGESAL